MGSSVYSLSTLFDQLGLPDDEESIEKFIREHRLEEGTEICEAEYWTPPQADFLREGLEKDSDWALIIDELNVRLHEG